MKEKCEKIWSIKKNHYLCTTKSLRYSRDVAQSG